MGLTASPGVGKSKNKLQAKEHILKLCANLDCAIKIPKLFAESVGKKSDSPKEIQRIVKGRPLDDPYFRVVSGIMGSIEGMLMDSEDGRRLVGEDGGFSKMASQRGQQSYEQAVVTLTKKIRQKVEEEEVLKELMICVTFLRKYNNSLYVNRDARTSDAIAYMEEFISELERSNPSAVTDVLLLGMCKDKLQGLKEVAKSYVSGNPVLIQLGKDLKKEYEIKGDSLSIIFTRTRESARALAQWLNEDEDLRNLELNAGVLIGGGNEGMTSSAQSTLLQMFKDGKHKVIVATSVAEEGLDIQKCNLVFRYNYVTSDIGHVQTKGRSRAFHGKIYLIVNSDLQLQYRELKNIIRVKLMEETVKEISEMDLATFNQRMLEEQKEDEIERRMEKERRDKMNREKAKGGEITLHCTKCNVIACELDDVKVINDAHHVVCNDILIDRMVLNDMKKPRVIDGIKFQQEVRCAKCKQKWGTMVVYKGEELPLIAAHNFIFNNVQGKKWLPKKWKEVPFVIQQIDLEDLIKQNNELKQNAPDGESEGEQSDDNNEAIEYSNIMQVDD